MIANQSRAITSEDILKLINIKDVKKFKQDINALKEQSGSTQTLLNNFIIATTDDLQELHNQVDGNITTWFLSGVPTLENMPAVQWTDDIKKDKHLGDLYYDNNTGYAYRFALESNVYSWRRITDTDITQALAIANSAKDTADSKRRVFVTQPTVPYDVGDLWIKDDLSLYRCRIAEPSSGTFNNADWIVATKYTDDTVANNALAAANAITQEVHENYATTASLNTTRDTINATVEAVTTRVTSVEGRLVDYEDTVSEVADLQVKTGEINSTVSEVRQANTDLSQRVSDNYAEVIDKFNDYAAVGSINELSSRVSEIQTNSYTKTEIQQIANGTGVDGVKVTAIISTEAQFDSNGMHYKKTDAPSETTVNQLGLEVDSTQDGSELLYAGYDEESGKSIVRTDNLTVTRYLKCGGSGRFEEYTDTNSHTGPGFFIDNSNGGD